MPQQRRFRRLGKVTTGISAGALMLVAMGAAAPAPAVAESTIAAAAPCPKPKDLPTWVKHWQCQWNKLFPPKKPNAPAKPKPSAPPKKTSPKPAPKAAKPGTRTPSRLTPRTGTSGGYGNGAQAYTQPDSLRPYTPGSTPNLPGLLPAPQVAADPGGYGGQGGGLADTRLIGPVAAHGAQQESDEMLWVALAAGAAGAVGAMNISILGRRLRRRAES